MKKFPCPKCNHKGYYIENDGVLRCNYCGIIDEDLRYTIDEDMKGWLKGINVDRLIQKYVYHQLKDAKDNIRQIKNELGVFSFICGRIQNNIENFYSYLVSVKPHDDYIDDFTREMYINRLYWKCIDSTEEIQKNLIEIFRNFELKNHIEFQKSSSTELFGEEIVVSKNNSIITIEDYIDVIDNLIETWAHNEKMSLGKS